jgi:hypothetical protein
MWADVAGAKMLLKPDGGPRSLSDFGHDALKSFMNHLVSRGGCFDGQKRHEN